MINAFFKQMYKAIFKPQDYYILGKVKVANAVYYVLILSVIYAIVGLIYISSYLHIGRLSDWIKFYSPDYNYSGGQLHAEEQYFNVIDDLGIYFDTTVPRMSATDVVNFANEYNFEKGAIFTARNMWIFVKGNPPVEFEYSDLRSEPFDKEWVIDNLDTVLGFAGAIIIVVLSIAVMAIYFLSALVLYVIAILITIVMKKQCSYFDLFNVCLYAKTLMFVVEMICLWIPIVNTGGIAFVLCSAVVSMIYIVIGIYRMHKYYPKQIRFGQ